jgi:solute carrier family 6 amino acid transporter-like protein 5/7/9/14
MYVLQLFDWYAASTSVILICIVEVVIVGWIYGK